METILFLLLLALTAYAWRPRRAQRPPAALVARLPASTPRRRQRSAQPFWPSFAAFVAQCAVSMKSTARAMHAAVILERDRRGAPPPRRRFAVDAMSSSDDGDDHTIDDDRLLLRVEPGTRNPEPENPPAQNPARTGDDSPEYVIPLGRCQALETYYSKGGTAMELCRIQEGDVEAIRAALARQTTGKVVAKAAGGSYEQRLEQVRQARQGEARDEG